jgi:hypothetical protein
MEEHGGITSIVFEHDGERYRCTVGQAMEKWTGRPPPLSCSIRPEHVTAIEERGGYYLVSYILRRGDASSWANPFMVGKSATLRLAFADGTYQDPFIYP